MPPDHLNSQICSVFLALAAAGPLQCERLELPVFPGKILKNMIENLLLFYTISLKHYYKKK